MTIRTQSHHPSTGAVIPSAGLEANFVELYDLQDGGIDGTNMNLAATFAWTGAHSFTGNNVIFDTNLLYVDATNNRIYEGATATTTIDSVDYQHQITALSAGIAAFALISTATGANGVFEARYHFSASPADGDRIWDLGIYGKNDAATDIKYATILAIVDDVTAGTEDSHVSIQAYNAGTLASRLLVYGDQVQVEPESLVVGTNTNVTPYGTGEILSLYVKSTSADRRVAMFESTDATASGIIYDIYKNSASPAASDVICQLRFAGNDSGGNANAYTAIISRITDTTNGSEDSQMDLQVQASGALTNFISAVSTAGAVEVTVTGQFTVVGNSNSITSPNTTGDAFTITASSLTTGSALVVYSNSSSASTRNLVEITNDNTSADNATCLYIQQDGNLSTTKAVDIALGTNAVGVHVTSGSATHAFKVTGSGTADIGLHMDGVVQAIYATNFSYLVTIAAGDYSGAAVGAYAGKIPISVGGLGTRYIPFYA